MVDEVVNEVTEDLKKIFQKEIGSVSSQNTEERIKQSVNEYVMSISEVMGYMNLPKIKTEREGPFLTLNFLDENGVRLETIGDLIYYMDTGINNGSKQ